jgi:hypothetical protein
MLEPEQYESVAYVALRQAALQLKECQMVSGFTKEKILADASAMMEEDLDEF